MSEKATTEVGIFSLPNLKLLNLLMTFPKWANTNIFILIACVKQINIEETPIKGFSNFLLLQEMS